MQTLIKIVTDGLGNVILMTDDEEYHRISVVEGTGVDELDIEEELIAQVRNLWRAINQID